MILLKFIVSVSGSHCAYSLGAPTVQLRHTLLALQCELLDLLRYSFELAPSHCSLLGTLKKQSGNLRFRSNEEAEFVVREYLRMQQPNFSCDWTIKLVPLVG